MKRIPDVRASNVKELCPWESLEMEGGQSEGLRGQGTAAELWRLEGQQEPEQQGFGLYPKCVLGSEGIVFGCLLSRGLT